ncbi:MAG: hypothetical protein IKF09_02800 [Clostridiales bacterium]|nr:hypothetical protein [Clostridiales bacterium]
MKRSLRSVSVLLAGIILLGGCTAAPTVSTAFEPQHKTETEVTNITDGMIPQVIEKSVTYVQNESEGEWIVESSEITKWDIASDFDISDSVWTVSTKDATTLGNIIDDSFKGLSATLYIRFGSDSADIQKNVNGGSSLDITFNMTGDFVFICNGNKFNFYDAAIKGASVKPDGTVSLNVDIGDGMAGDIIIPASVQKCGPEEFMIKQSDTYFEASFDGIPNFEVTSENLKGCVWDPKISNTTYGENVSPELTWSPVDGATDYVVIMIDSNWLHMDVFTTETSLAEGAIGRGDKGAQFVGPYPPKGSTHTYSVFVFALKGEPGKVPMAFDNGANSIFKIFDGLDVDTDGNSGNVLAFGRLDGNFTMK